MTYAPLPNHLCIADVETSGACTFSYRALTVSGVRTFATAAAAAAWADKLLTAIPSATIIREA